MIQERKHRLPKKRYIGRLTAAFTVCVLNKERLFTNDNIVSPIENILLDALKSHKAEAHVYLFMPDHLHLLIEGSDKTSNFWKCMVNFKQRSGYWLSQMGRAEKWQKDFYDHILRKNDDLIKQAKYILGNPVRSRLVANWRDYKFKGSTIYNFDNW